MSDSILRYDRMVENALRGVVRDALAETALHGLPGDHHFYITFHTAHPGVVMSDHIRARHPDEMTVVLQHQFWDLEVDDEGFEVTLSFSGKSERLVVPFAAVSGFADPSAKFGLQFQVIEADDAIEDMDEEEEEAAPAASPAPAHAAGSDNKVVALDAFRKK